MLWAKPTLNNSCQPETIQTEALQTELTDQDLSIIERLVTIAQSHSAEILEAKAALGLSAFQETVSLELEPSFSIGSSEEDEANSYTDGSFSSTITIDPIRLISVFQQFPGLRARLNQNKNQKRVDVVKYYVAYIQSRQVAQVSTYRMQALSGGDCVTDLKTPSASSRPIKSLVDKEYTDMAVERLTASGQARIALEELAACIGLSPQQTMTILEDPIRHQSP